MQEKKLKKIIKMLGAPCIKTVKIGGSTYIIKIEKYIPIKEQIDVWKKALDISREND